MIVRSNISIWLMEVKIYAYNLVYNTYNQTPYNKQSSIRPFVSIYILEEIKRKV